MERTSDWTGEVFTGKGYILNTTDGPILVSEAEFLEPYYAAGVLPRPVVPAVEEPVQEPATS